MNVDNSKNTEPVFKSNEPVIMGENNLNQHMGYPLALSYLVVFICRQGRAVISVNFKKYVMKVNDILVLYDDSIAVVLNKSRNFNIDYFSANKDFAAEIAYQLPNYLFSFLAKSPLCITDTSLQRLLSMWLEQAQYIMCNCSIYKLTMMRNQIQNLFLAITEKIPNISPLEQTTIYSRKEILCWRFWEMVGKHCLEHRDVAFYAKALSITPFYLSQITKEFFNDSPKTLIDRQVILEIKALLRFSDISIKTIADKLNFDDPSYMCRYFKRQTGVSLSRYRH